MGGRGWGCWRPPPHHQPPHFLEEPSPAQYKESRMGSDKGLLREGGDLAHQGSWGPRRGLGSGEMDH